LAYTSVYARASGGSYATHCQDFHEQPKQGDDVILSARPKDWSVYLTSGPVASKEFMEGIEDLPMQEREL
jgi:hypothetical protein